jgi:hypothetical protein
VAGEFGLEEGAVRDVVGGVGGELDDALARGVGEAGEGVEATAAVVVGGTRAGAHLDQDVGVAGEGAAAAGGLAGLAFLFARMMEDQDGKPQGREALQGHQSREDRRGVVLTFAGEEAGERIDDDQREAAGGVLAGDMVEESDPVLGARLAAEGAAEPADVVAEVEAAMAGLPVVRPSSLKTTALPAASDNPASSPPVCMRASRTETRVVLPDFH